MLDAAILLLFAVSIALCKPGRREQARDSVAAFGTSATLAADEAVNDYAIGWAD